MVDVGRWVGGCVGVVVDSPEWREMLKMKDGGGRYDYFLVPVDDCELPSRQSGLTQSARGA